MVHGRSGRLHPSLRGSCSNFLGLRLVQVCVDPDVCAVDSEGMVVREEVLQTLFRFAGNLLRLGVSVSFVLRVDFLCQGKESPRGYPEKV